MKKHYLRMIRPGKVRKNRTERWDYGTASTKETAEETKDYLATNYNKHRTGLLNLLEGILSPGRGHILRATCIT